jgi:hypothetical protein
MEQWQFEAATWNEVRNSRNTIMESGDSHAVWGPTSSFTLYTVHFQFVNALMTADQKQNTADWTLRNTYGLPFEKCWVENTDGGEFKVQRPHFVQEGYMDQLCWSQNWDSELSVLSHTCTHSLLHHNHHVLPYQTAPLDSNCSNSPMLETGESPYSVVII